MERKGGERSEVVNSIALAAAVAMVARFFEGIESTAMSMGNGEWGMGKEEKARSKKRGFTGLG